MVTWQFTAMLMNTEINETHGSPIKMNIKLNLHKNESNRAKIFS